MNQKRSIIKLFKNSLLWRISYPNPCPGCTVHLSPKEEGICVDCSALMPRTTMEVTRDNRIETTIRTSVPVEAAMALFHFREGNVVQEMIHLLKYRDKPNTGEAFGIRMGRAMVDNPDFEAIDTLVPVPLHKGKERRRGYNQSALIANGIAKVMNAQIVDNAVIRDRKTLTQARQKTAMDRHLNVEGAFRVTQPELLAGRNILLIDDVFTTGATAIACLRTLTTIPDAKLWFAAAATPV